MDIRNVQRTGDMFYLYLPTKWCKKFGISAKSKVGVQINSDGALMVYPQASKKEPIKLNLKAAGTDVESLHKLIVACYISPADAFRISLNEELDFTKILNQKNLLSLELVEIDGNHISCESTVQISDPLSLLSTMIRKTKNLLLVVSKNGNRDLIERYEEEIDRSKLLIEKAVIRSLTNPSEADHKAIELHFISLLSKELERMVDHLIALKKPQATFVKNISDALGEFQQLITDLSYQKAMQFVARVGKLQKVGVKDVATYDMRRVVRALNGISDVMIDWAVIKETEL